MPTYVGSCPYFDVVRQMKNAFDYRLRLVTYARQHGAGDLGITRVGDRMQFRVAAQPKSIIRPEWGAFMPFYKVGQGFPYRMYFDLG